MCGVVGYVGTREASPILLKGLRSLEYRGYDSAGVSVWAGGQSRVVRARGKLSNLEAKLGAEPVKGTIGIGHTRWATHGRPSDENAHPHKVGAISVIHNGIIENHLALRQELVASGSKFSSETDTEIFAHLIDRAIKGGAADLTTAVRGALSKVKGTYAFVVMSDDEPNKLVAARHASPMIVGLGDGENFIASDVTAILSETRRALFIDDGEVVIVTPNKVTIFDAEGKERTREPTVVTWNAMQAEKGGFKHFMMKEIHEQPRAVADTMTGRIDVERGDINLDGIDLDVQSIKRIVFVACGTSWHASLVGEYLIEQMARIPVEVELASEFRYRDPIVGPGDLIIAVSQSGETADTMAAIKEAKGKGAKVLAIANVLGSSIPRSSDHAFYTHAGPEIGVASTKAFTTQLVAMTMLAIYLGRRTGKLPEQKARELIGEMSRLPARMKEVIDHAAQIQILARRYGNASGCLFLGRGAQTPIALEGALKLKEISYIHAEGYAAGEMKHGPIALIDENLAVVVLAPKGPSYEKVLSNLSEVKARNGRILAVATAGDTELGGIADDVIIVPDVPIELQPILTVIPLQLFSYYVADLKGTDIDQPRNLAKSVTVE